MSAGPPADARPPGTPGGRAARPRRTAAEREALRPHIAEWFGHRVFPTVAAHEQAQRDQREQRCPFLSQVAERDYGCVKAPNSRGVCTVSAGSNGSRQDWLVCPHRALDDDLLHAMVRRLYGLGDAEPVHVLPVTNLADLGVRARFLAAAADPTAPRQFLAFQQLFGGEIGLSRTPASPELSFDATIVEVGPDSDGDHLFTPQLETEAGPPPVRLGRYGVIEVQTADTHGSYRHAVEALASALDLHADDFPAQIAAHPDWPGRKVEGPNISNVFKRTFYQVMVKFQLTRREGSAGCVLAIPRPVWDSWQPFLGAPELVDRGDGTSRLVAAGEQPDDDPVLSGRQAQPPNWIYVFDIDEQPPPDGQPTPVRIDAVIGTDAPSLSRLALDVAPARAADLGGQQDAVAEALRRRLARYAPELL